MNDPLRIDDTDRCRVGVGSPRAHPFAASRRPATSALACPQSSAGAAPPRIGGRWKPRLAALLAVWLTSAALFPGPTAAQPDAGASRAESRDLLKEYNKLRNEHYYRHASALYDMVWRFAQAADSLSTADLFVKAFYEGRWDEVAQTLEQLPDDMAGEIYNRMLSDLTGRNVPVLSLEDFLGLADACPGELDPDRVRKLGLLLRVAVPEEQEIWLRQALERGTKRFGGDSRQLVTGRVLMHAGFGELARSYLPSVLEAARIDDAAVRDEILQFLASQEELSRIEQTQIAGIWAERAAAIADPRTDEDQRQQAAEQLVDLLGRAPAATLAPWISDLWQQDRPAALRLAVALGRRTQGRLNDADVAQRTNYLAAQQVLLQQVGRQVSLTEPPWDTVALAMADAWVREAEFTFEVRPSYRARTRNKPHVAPGELLAAAPEGIWAGSLPANLRERIDVCLSQAVLVSDRYQEAVERIVALASRNRQAGASLAEEYLQAWAYRHDPQVPEEVRKKFNLAADARIAVTSIMSEKNIAALAEMMERFRQSGSSPRNAELLVNAFDVCYSDAEVYQRRHIEQVFGPIAEAEESIFVQLIGAMTKGLASRWRSIDVQLESGTRRTDEETLAMVRRGYQAAIEMIDERCRVDPGAWRLLTLAGSLLSDWGDFEYYQQLAAGTPTDRLVAFREQNNLAQTYFARAAAAYAAEVPRLAAEETSIETYLAAFHSLLGINSDGRLNLSKPLDRAALERLRDAIRGLPGEASGAHIQLFARHVQARLDDPVNPLHEQLKYKYLAGSLVITKESPFAFQASEQVAYYDQLLEETRLTTRVDGPSTIFRDHEFGIVLSVHHTEALGRMADFGKYLVNELPPPNSPARKAVEQNLATTYQLGELQGRRDELELNIREALELFFDVRAIAFSPKDVQPRPAGEPGWEETVLAYIQAKAKDASVDKIPRIQLNLEFLDLTGPVEITAESAETMIKVTDQPTPPRPFERVEIGQTLDPRGLEDRGEILLEIEAMACGLVPELEQLLDLPSLQQQLPIARIDPHQGTVLSQVNSWGETVHAVSERRWTIALDAASLIEPPRTMQLVLPQPLVDAAVTRRGYVELELVDLSEPVVAVGAERTVAARAESVAAAHPELLYLVIGGGAALLSLVALAIAWRLRRRGERPLRARDVFGMPAEVDSFAVVQLLRSLGGSELVRLNSSQREELRRDLQRIEGSCFAAAGDGELSEDDLRGVARKWLRAAC